jgi:pantoate--beta-alanine ligase
MPDRPLKLLESIAAVRAFVAQARVSGQRVALVPTMGALHEGHLSLMRAAGETAECVIASIFVNPTQFAAGEDLDQYPRDPEGDLAKARSAGCAAVFMPTVDTMYPPGAQTRVSVPALASPLCGQNRPTHFTGVATIVLKLLNIVGPDIAVFGEKDYQQLAVIRRMVRDLDVPVRVVGHPIVREADGLAMSSRNAYLSAAERADALSLHQGLDAAEAAWNAGLRDPRQLEAMVSKQIRGGDIDYVEARDADDLSGLEGTASGDVVLAVAVRYGRTRLIDNRRLGSS